MNIPPSFRSHNPAIRPEPTKHVNFTPVSIIHVVNWKQALSDFDNLA